MRNYRLIISGLLLSLVTLTAVAQENISLQGCRRGTPRSQSIHLHRGGIDARIPGGDFYHGERHQLTILVAFNDRLFQGDEAATLEKWNKIFNAENLVEEPFKGSVHDYFFSQSYGKFNIIFDLLYLQISGDAKKYASTYSHDENSQYMVQDIMEMLKNRDDIDWGKYDWNGNGYINQLLIVYAGEGMNAGGGSNTIWPHQWWMSEHLKDWQQDVYCDPIPVSSGGKDYLVDCYCCVQEEVNTMTSTTSFGTICHEYSHCFGFPDFYYQGGIEVVGEWDIMDYGNYTGRGYQPVGYSAHERWLMGWLTPIELTSTTSVVNMPALADEGRAYLIRNDGYQNEYYIVENRQPTGWDACIPGNGILVYHIDFDPSIWTSTTTFPNSKDYKRYELFHANNNTSIIDLEEWAYPFEGNNSLTNTSSPAAVLIHENSDGTKLMSKPITNMKVTSRLASFDFDVTTDISEVTTKGADKLLYRLGMVDIVRDANGNIRKIIRK